MIGKWHNHAKIPEKNWPKMMGMMDIASGERNWRILGRAFGWQKRLQIANKSGQKHGNGSLQKSRWSRRGSPWSGNGNGNIMYFLMK
jgi:hypothetical protein